MLMKVSNSLARSANGQQAEALILRQVDKSYDGATKVVDALDLDVHPGEFLTILGPSGSGKTSLLMMLAGFEQPSAGTIEIGGRDVSRLPPYKRNIGMVFQHYALFPHLTVGENLAYPLQARGWWKAEITERVAWALQLIRLDGMKDRRPAQLSGGQQQRIAVARALIYNPQLVLMDEPLGALDKQLREQMQDEIVRLHRELRPTIVYVTHDQSEALSLSDRVAVFEAGRIAQIGTPSELYEEPRTAFVAGFIGENNRINGTVIATDAEFCRVRCTDGASLDARNIASVGIGDKVNLAVRPERLRPAQVTDGFSVEVEVADITYLGEVSRVRCRRLDGTEIIWKVPNCGQSTRPERGARIALSFRREDARAFPA
ncbi:MAG TPA: ABC transporter ATP-binding protein [Ancylobacter sp.]